MNKLSRGKEYHHKPMCMFKDRWLIDFNWLQKGDNLDTLYCHICKMFQQTQDMTSALYLQLSKHTGEQCRLNNPDTWFSLYICSKLWNTVISVKLVHGHVEKIPKSTPLHITLPKSLSGHCYKTPLLSHWHSGSQV